MTEIEMEINQPHTQTIADNEKQSKIELIVSNILCLLIFFSFGYIAIMSIFQTSVFNPENYVNEEVIYEADDLILNIIFTAGFLAIVFWLRRFYDFFAKIDLRMMEIALAIWTLILGMIWIFSVSSVPAADSQNIYELASNAAKDNYTPLYNSMNFYQADFFGGHSYFNFYPFQLGFVLFSEMIFRVFGYSSPMLIQIFNLVFLSSAYLALARITRLIFKKKSIEFIVILLLAACLQPIMMCTFVYGNVIGMSAGIWASLFLIKYFKTNRRLWLVPSGLALTFAVLIKYNSLIYLVAFVIMLIIHTIREKKWQSIAFALAVCVTCIGVTPLIIKNYEARANTKIESGVSQTMYLDMGMQESPMAPGWYTTTAMDDYRQGNYDAEQGNQIAGTHISQRLNAFMTNPNYAFDFYSKKILSQWNEPSYECVWVSKVKSHSYELNGFAKDVYDGSTGQLLQLHFNFYMQLVFILFALGIYMLFIKRMARTETLLLPLVVLGAFGYHVLFEAKSQYSATYIPLLLPTAAFMMSMILFSDYSKIKQLLKKINRKKEKTAVEDIETVAEEDDFQTYLTEAEPEIEYTTYEITPEISESAEDLSEETPDEALSETPTETLTDTPTDTPTE